MNSTEKLDDIFQLNSLRDVIRWGVSQLNQSPLYFGHGTDNAFDEMIHLLFPLLHLPYAIADPYLDCQLTQNELNTIKSALYKRIIERIPVAYITHQAWFCGLQFYVDERVLIPRSPLAELIASQFTPWLTHQTPTILELCTGSACIAIACADQIESSTIDASDISKTALEVASINVENFQMEERINLIESDLFANINKKYDLIIANPPYVDAQEISNLTTEYQHEPILALAAGEDGLDIARRILEEATNYLTDNGLLILEVGASSVALQAAFPELPFLWLTFKHGGDGVCLLTYSQLKMI